MKQADEVLAYWFGTLKGLQDYPADKAAIWFKKSTATDDDIRRRFGDLVVEAQNGGLKQWEAQPRHRLALIILIDQFTRNIFRGHADAFRADHRAYQLAVTGMEAGMDQQLHLIERVFFYLPLEHAESMLAQDQSIAAYQTLLKLADAGFQGHAQGFLDYAHSHRKVIEQFGRYPHRNAILDRSSSAEEVIFLSKPGSSF